GGLGVVTLNSGVINNTLGQSVVGSWGTGTLHINSGGHFSGHHMSVGSCETGDGTVNINGFGKLNVWSLTSHADSEAQLNITDGGTLRVSSPTQNLFENFGVGDTTVDGWGFIEIMGNDVSTATNFGGFSGDGHLFKTENGSLTLHGTNTLNGFYVQEGSLIVEGEVTGFVRVAAGAKVSGSGVTGEMTLSNAHLAPGSSPGEITVASLSFEGDNTIDFELGVDPSQSDLITVIGALTNDSGEILFNFINNGWVDGQTYDLINFGVSSISLADYDYRSDDSDLVGGVFSLNGNTLQFTPDIIPEPSSALLLVLAGFGLLRRQR
ncbi:MAG: PEP-CTERM sorting domain-containing protein, partial [Verrucomicrobiales bacterium]